MTTDLQMSFLWDFTWIWALWDYSLCKDYGSNPSQSQLMVWLCSSSDTNDCDWHQTLCSQSVWKTQSGRQCGEFHQLTGIAGGQDLSELRRHILSSVRSENLGPVFEQEIELVRKPSAD